MSTLLATVCLAGSANATYADGNSSGAVSPAGIVISPQIDTNWRYTKYGWQNTSSWVSPRGHVPRQTIQMVHPLVWAGIVLISVLTTMIWASSEWDFARLFNHADENEMRLKPEPKPPARENVDTCR